MDPNETLNQIGRLGAGEGTQQEAEEYCCDLKEWIINGGFEPNWSAYPEGAAFFCQWEDETSNPDCELSLAEAADWQSRAGAAL